MGRAPVWLAAIGMVLIALLFVRISGSGDSSGSPPESAAAIVGPEVAAEAVTVGQSPAQVEEIDQVTQVTTSDGAVAEASVVAQPSRIEVISTVEERYGSESVDAGWAPVTESLIFSALASSGAPYDDAEIECRSTICRVTLIHLDLSIGRPAFVDDLSDHMEAVVASDERLNGMVMGFTERPEASGGGLVTSVILDGAL